MCPGQDFFRTFLNPFCFPSSDIVSQKHMDLKSSHFPYCIVWTLIPILTYIIPSLGQTGIENSNEIIHNWQVQY